MMRFGSLFSGIGGFDLGFERAGMQCVWQVEIDANCRRVLQKHFTAEIYNDVREFKNAPAVDLICGGFPCQDLSVAGPRAGLAGERSGLWFEFHRIIAESRPQWVVIENVPGLLSSNKGQDFAIVLRGLVECGYGVAWRVLDAQYFGVAQRRRRVFIIGSLGDGRAAQVLFEREGGAWDTAPSKEAPAGTAGDVAYCITERSGQRMSREDNYIAGTLPADYGKQGGNGMGNMENGMIPVARTLSASGAHRRKDRPDGGMYVNETDTALTVGTTDMTAIAFQSLQYKGIQELPQQKTQRYGVRRLTPLEAERLQGFPDGWTAGQSDSARYCQLGNAVCVPVAEWIARRINNTYTHIFD